MMAFLFSPHAVFFSVIVWHLNLVDVSAGTALTLQNLRLVEDVRFTDVLPRNDTFYLDSLDDDRITMCALKCVTRLPYCSAILYNGGQGTCKLLKSHLNESLVDRTSVKKGWKLFINDKACDDQWVPFNGHCYLFDQTKATMEDAETRCDQQNAHVVEIGTSEENTWILENFLLPFSYMYPEPCGRACWSWIGYSDRQEEGVFAWVHNNHTTWENWYPGEPNDFGSHQDCATISPPIGLWYDHGCSDHLTFTCEKNM